MALENGRETNDSVKRNRFWVLVEKILFPRKFVFRDFNETAFRMFPNFGKSHLETVSGWMCDCVCQACTNQPCILSSRTVLSIEVKLVA